MNVSDFSERFHASHSTFILFNIVKNLVTCLGCLRRSTRSIANERSPGGISCVAVTASLRVSLMIWSAQRNGGRPLGRFAEGLKLGIGPLDM